MVHNLSTTVSPPLLCRRHKMNDIVGFCCNETESSSKIAKEGANPQNEVEAFRFCIYWKDFIKKNHIP